MCVHNKTILTNRGTTGEDEQDEMKNEKKGRPYKVLGKDMEQLELIHCNGNFKTVWKTGSFLKC